MIMSVLSFDAESIIRYYFDIQFTSYLKFMI